MELRPELQVADTVLAAFARRYGIARLALFGSVLRGDFNENSDVDLLVEFEPGHTPGLFALAAMERELEATIGRAVDLRTYHDLSRYFRDDVAASARIVYAA
ncbi:MAG: nucleotidyltransferase family protein [Pseudonocardiaceae bacterium]